MAAAVATNSFAVALLYYGEKIIKFVSFVMTVIATQKTVFLVWGLLGLSMGRLV
jgi:hypothetical protein